MTQEQKKALKKKEKLWERHNKNKRVQKRGY